MAQSVKPASNGMQKLRAESWICSMQGLNSISFAQQHGGWLCSRSMASAMGSKTCSIPLSTPHGLTRYSVEAFFFFYWRYLG